MIAESVALKSVLDKSTIPVFSSRIMFAYVFDGSKVSSRHSTFGEIWRRLGLKDVQVKGCNMREM